MSPSSAWQCMESLEMPSSLTPHTPCEGNETHVSLHIHTRTQGRPSHTRHTDTPDSQTNRHTRQTDTPDKQTWKNRHKELNGPRLTPTNKALISTCTFSHGEKCGYQTWKTRTRKDSASEKFHKIIDVPHGQLRSVQRHERGAVHGS